MLIARRQYQLEYHLGQRMIQFNAINEHFKLQILIMFVYEAIDDLYQKMRVFQN